MSHHQLTDVFEHQQGCAKRDILGHGKKTGDPPEEVNVSSGVGLLTGVSPISMYAVTRVGPPTIWPPEDRNRILEGRWFCFSIRVAQVTRWCSIISPAS